MKRAIPIIHVTTGLISGTLLGSWLSMLCFGPFGFLFFFSEKFAPATLAWHGALPAKPLAIAMLGIGLLPAYLPLEPPTPSMSN